MSLGKWTSFCVLLFLDSHIRMILMQVSWIPGSSLAIVLPLVFLLSDQLPLQRPLKMWHPDFLEETQKFPVGLQ